MALTESIKTLRDMELKHIDESKYLANGDKILLSKMIMEAAECTNGYTPEEKVQHLSQTTFGLTTLVAKVIGSLSRNNQITDSNYKKLDEINAQISDMTKKLDTHVENCKSDCPKQNVQKIRKIEDLDWMDTLKLILVKPWIWICVGITFFSPKGVEIIQLLLNYFGK